MSTQLHPSTADILKSFDVISSLAQVYRHNTMTFDAQRKENVAEHSYSLATLGCALAQEINKELPVPLDIGKVAQFALTHDLTEAFMPNGDISVYASKKLLASKESEEELALQQLEKQTSSLPWTAQTIKDYQKQTSAEARYVYALDKIIVHMIIALSNQHHIKPAFGHYLKTELVARKKIQRSFPYLLSYFDELCEMFRERPHLFSDSPS